MTESSRQATAVPAIVPLPPLSSVPPRTTAVIAFISMPMPAVASAVLSRAEIISDAAPARKPLSA